MVGERLDAIVRKEEQMVEISSIVKGIPMIYSPKLDKYVPLDSGNSKGEIQRYNIGISPGSWY